MARQAEMILVIVVLLFGGTLFAEEVSYVNFSADIPEDFGVNFPDHAKRLDRLVFAVDVDIDTESAESGSGVSYIHEDGLIDIGDITVNDGVSFSLLYYGNLSQPYDVVVSIDKGAGFVSMEDGISRLPMEVFMSAPETPSDYVKVRRIDDENIQLTVEPAGIMQGLRVLDIDVGWQEGFEALPGRYMADLEFELMTI